MRLKLTSVLGNSQKLDGGAMFGNVPKALWNKWVTADIRNRIDLACRALLVETGNHCILFEVGVGAFMEPKLRDRYGVVEDSHVLLENLAALDLSHEHITDIVLSHMHFDHAGGLLSAYQQGETPQLLFPNATYHVGERAWARAVVPHPRDRASFVPELNAQMEASGRLKLVKLGEMLHFDDLDVGFFNSSGHTPGLICADLRWDKQRLVFVADLIPGRPWIHLPITMGFDRFPEALIEEKKALLDSLLDEAGWLFFTHDPEVCAAQVIYSDENHKYQPDKCHASFTRISSLEQL